VDGFNFQTAAPMPTLPTIQFSAATYGVNENSSFVTINVTRAGDTSGASSVDYRTNDNFTDPTGCAALTSALNQRCDYTPAQGVLNFAPGETVKTFTIPLTDDFYPENNDRRSCARQSDERDARRASYRHADRL
jgi:hypothetical protein